MVSHALNVLLTVIFSGVFGLAHAEVIRVISRGDANANYAIGMLKLSLEYADTQYKVEIKEGALTPPRQIEMLKGDELDIMWTATNTGVEKQILPVRVPLYKGLLGFRILIIHRDNRDLFANVRTLNDLKRFKMGQGRGWTDTDIMLANGLNVVQASKYHSLFLMTDGNRFDGFPRGVNEPWSEIKSRPELELTVDENIMLVYKMPFYLFVNPSRKQLAEDITNGLHQAIDDGRFDKYFFASPTVKTVFDNVNMKNRQVFELVNPILPSETPLDDARLWYQIDAQAELAEQL